MKHKKGENIEEGSFPYAYNSYKGENSQRERENKENKHDPFLRHFSTSPQDQLYRNPLRVSDPHITLED